MVSTLVVQPVLGLGLVTQPYSRGRKCLVSSRYQYPVALMSVSCFNDSPRIYHVINETPREVTETVLRDMHSRQLLFKLFKKLKKASLANVFQEQVNKSLNEGHVPSYL